MLRRKLADVPVLAVALVAAALVLCLSACADQDRGTGSFSLQDSAGVRVATSNQPAWTSGAGWRVDTVPLLDIGTIEGDLAYQLFRVRGAVRLNDGVIIVANAGTHQLRMYGGDGEHIRDVGRRGEGPGEFQSLNWLGLYHRDSLVAWDASSRRVSVFDRNGTFVRSMSLNVRGAVRGVFDDGAVLIEESVVRGPTDFAGSLPYCGASAQMV